MIKNFIRFAVEKSVLNHIFLVFLVVLAIFSYQKIPKEIFPPSNLDIIYIGGGYVGTSPDVLDKIAVKEIEDEIINLNDIDRIESSIKSGAFSINVYLKESADKNALLDDIKDIISSQKKDLPSDMSEPTAKLVVHSYPLISIAIAAEKSTEEILEVADKMKSALSKIEDLSDISIYGDSDKELIFKIDEKRLRAYDLGINEVYSAIASLSDVFPVGVIKEQGSHLFVSTKGGESDTEKLQNTYLDIAGRKIKLKEIANINFSLAEPSVISHFNGVKNLTISISKSKKGNAIALAKEIKKIVSNFKKEYKEYHLETYSDSSIWIRNRLNTVISNILFGLILVSLSVWIFISGRIAIVVGLGIPVSFMIGLLCTDLMGYSLNMLSLLGALIALGMLVDEAIVVAENIYRHLENGDSPKDAAINGAAEMFPAVLTATATTIFAFLPLLIMSGEMGVFMRILPIMISILLLSSLLEAFFFLPLHAKDILKVKDKTKKNESWWLLFNSVYNKALSFIISYKKSVLVTFVIGSFLLIKLFFSSISFQLFPDFDSTQVYINGKVNINYDLEDTQKIVNEIEKKLLGKFSKDEISSIASSTGFMLDAKYRAHTAENNFHIFVNLRERKPENFFNRYINPYLSPEYDDSDMKRERSALEILDTIKIETKEFSKDKRFEEFKAFVPGAGIVSNDIEIALSSSDTTLLEKSIDDLKKKMQKVEGIFNVEDDLEPGKKELKLRVNEYGQSLGFNEKLISSYLRPYFFKAESGKMFYNGELIKIRTQEKMKDDYNSIENFTLTIPKSGQKVRLKEVVDFEFQDGYSDIYKDDAQRVSSIYASLKKSKITSANFYKLIDEELEAIKKLGIEVKIKGEEQENAKIQEEMMQAAIIAIFLIFLALVWMFDSIVLSIIILTSIPLSLVGVLGGHLLMGMNLTMPGLLGVVGLSGVVVNDGIIMMDFIKKSQSIEELKKYATMRLRPIMLTSLTTILGLSTLIFFAAGQAVILQPMAISLGFGIAWATILNLFYIPTIYSLIKGKKLAN